MNKYNLIENILSNNKMIRLRIYALEYKIEFNDKYIIYPILYQNRKYSYNSLKELFENYMIYNEPIIQNVDRIRILNINM